MASENGNSMLDNKAGDRSENQMRLGVRYDAQWTLIKTLNRARKANPMSKANRHNEFSFRLGWRTLSLAILGAVILLQGCAPLYYPMNPPANSQSNGYANTYPNAYAQPYSQNYGPYPNPYSQASQQHGNGYSQVYTGNLLPPNSNYQPAVVVVKSCECPPQGLGFVRIHSAPPFASVYVNGKSEGETPLEYISIPAGQAHIELIHRQFGPADTIIEVRPGQKIDLKMHLAEFNGTHSDDE
jgi:hypothetical protein